MRFKALTGLLAASVLGACGGAPERSQRLEPGATRIAEVNRDRPCSLITPEISEELSGQPHYRTMVADFVEGDHVTCAQAVGAGGVQSVARVVVHLPAVSGPAELLFAALCRGDRASAMSDGRRGRPRMQPANAVAPDLPPGACQLPSGGYAVLVSDRVFEAAWEESGGGLDPALSQALALKVVARVRGPHIGLQQRG